MDNDKKSNELSCEFCHASEDEKPVFTTQYKGRKLHVYARCLPGLIHG